MIVHARTVPFRFGINKSIYDGAYRQVNTPNVEADLLPQRFRSFPPALSIWTDFLF